MFKLNISGNGYSVAILPKSCPTVIGNSNRPKLRIGTIRYRRTCGQRVLLTDPKYGKALKNLCGNHYLITYSIKVCLILPATEDS